MSLNERYHQILDLRREGLHRYGGSLTSDLYGPPRRFALPSVSLREPRMPSVKRGPLFFGDHPPIMRVVDRWLGERAGRATTVAEIGPGKGTLAGAMRAAHGDAIRGYFGLDRDPTASGPYERVGEIAHLPAEIDLFVASEVIEHMSPEDFFEHILPAVAARLADDGACIVGTPNALTPGSIFGDFTHVQGYAWFDLYALLRLFFRDVEIYRTRYVWSPARLLTLVPRTLLCRVLELDECEGLVAVGRNPLRAARLEAAPMRASA